MTEQAFTYETDCDATWTTKSTSVPAARDESHEATCHGLLVKVTRSGYGSVMTQVRGAFAGRNVYVYSVPSALLGDAELRADAIAFAADLRSRGMEPIR